ncbi:ArsR/SmtB family transcription factor [Singulisphaera rosea]
MRAKIVLLDGVVVEAEGSAQEIAELTAALRRSHQVTSHDAGDRVALNDTSATDIPELEEPGRDHGLTDMEDIERTEKEELVLWGLEADEKEDVDPEEPEDQAEDTDPPVREATVAASPSFDKVVREVANQFRILADPTRLQILILLADQSHNVGELCEVLLGQSQPAVSHHLALLRVSGLVTPSREGQFNFYNLTDQGVTLTEAVLRFGNPDGTRVSALFRQASDPTRLQILIMLSGGDRNVGELCSDLGGMSQPAVSHHLALLRHGGLVETRRVGKFNYYSLRQEGSEVTRLVSPMRAAMTQSGSVTEGETSDVEEFDLSAIPDEVVEDDPPTMVEANDEEKSDPVDAPTAHLLCRRVRLTVQELHRRFTSG